MPDRLSLQLCDVQHDLPGVATKTGWDLPGDLTERKWADLGRLLGHMERSVQWWIGEWWMHGDAKFHGARKIVTADDWDGPSYKTCVNAATCCRKFPSARRRALVPFSHHAEVASLPAELADRLLDQAQRQAEETGEPPPKRAVRNLVKSHRRAQREMELAKATEQASCKVGSQLYGVIYTDPPWRFEPFSRESGMDRAADNHYPTLDADALAALELPAADDCVLFCWSTIAMLPAAMTFLRHHGFVYRSAYGWLKPGPGTGYWSQADQLELLLVGVRGEVPAPAPGTQPPQVLTIPRGKHSAKPDEFAAMIERMFSNVAKLEMFARKLRPGWDVRGNEVEANVAT
jgi:N6-adenosine-specific RNA methylase IME4